jgi:hypothetical protein
MSVQTEMLGGRLAYWIPRRCRLRKRKLMIGSIRHGLRGPTAFPSRARLRTEDLSVHSTQFSSVRLFHRAF